MHVLGFRLSIVAAIVIARTSGAQSNLVPLRVWVSAETDDPIFCLKLDSNGTAHFVGGFESLNPLAWTYDTMLGGRLSLTIPKLDSIKSRFFQEGTHRDLGPATFDATTKTATYNIGAGAPVWFLGFTLGSPAALDSATYDQTRRRCNLPSRH